MRNKTHGMHTKKSVIENQLIPINDKHQSQDMAAHYRTDKRDFKSSKMVAAEDWFEADEDSELEMFDIDARDFALMRVRALRRSMVCERQDKPPVTEVP